MHFQPRAFDLNANLFIKFGFSFLFYKENKKRNLHILWMFLFWKARASFAAARGFRIQSSGSSDENAFRITSTFQVLQLTKPLNRSYGVDSTLLSNLKWIKVIQPWRWTTLCDQGELDTNLKIEKWNSMPQIVRPVHNCTQMHAYKLSQTLPNFIKINVLFLLFRRRCSS